MTKKTLYVQADCVLGFITHLKNVKNIHSKIPSIESFISDGFTFRNITQLLACLEQSLKTYYSKLMEF
jgi:hypothetical protein